MGGLVLIIIVLISLVIWSTRQNEKKKIIKYKTALDNSFILGKLIPDSLNIDSIKKIKENIPKSDASQKNILIIEKNIYQAVIDKVLDDKYITDSESAIIKLLESILSLTQEEIANTKKEIFMASYIEAVQDKIITEQELTTLNNLIDGLGISKETIKDQLDVVHEMRRAQLLTLPLSILSSVKSPLKTQKNEKIFYESPAQVLTRKKSKMTSNGYEYTVRRAGFLVVTDRRILVTGDGITAISLPDVKDLDVDIDDAVIQISKYSSGRSVYIRNSEPIYAGKIIELLSLSFEN
jgi:hypothetical protein